MKPKLKVRREKQNNINNGKEKRKTLKQHAFVHTVLSPHTHHYLLHLETANMPPTPPEKIQLPALSFVKALLAICTKYPRVKLVTSRLAEGFWFLGK